MKELIKNILEGLNVKKENIIFTGNENIVKDVATNVEEYVKNNLNNFNLNSEDIIGESKRVFKDSKSDLCLIKLKPTMYSFTNNRYGEVKNCDLLRNKLWKIFSDEINNTVINKTVWGMDITKYSEYVDKLATELFINDKIKPNYPFVTSYLGQIEINNEIYNICKYVKKESPLEIVWKEYFTGTMKHNLLDVELKNTRYGKPIELESKIPEIVRFDWRNPFERNGVRYKDEAIPDDFANFYIDTYYAKILCKLVSNIIKEFLEKHGYRFVDTCYFMDMDSTLVFNEITPDGMRIKSLKDDGSFDKDLWRQGKDSETINKMWTKLINDLSEE